MYKKIIWRLAYPFRWIYRRVKQLARKVKRAVSADRERDKKIVWWVAYTFTMSSDTFAWLSPSESKKQPPWGPMRIGSHIEGFFDDKESAWEAIQDFATERSLIFGSINELELPFQGYHIAFKDPKYLEQGILKQKRRLLRREI